MNDLNNPWNRFKKKLKSQLCKICSNFWHEIHIVLITCRFGSEMSLWLMMQFHPKRIRIQVVLSSQMQSFLMIRKQHRWKVLFNVECWFIIFFHIATSRLAKQHSQTQCLNYYNKWQTLQDRIHSIKNLSYTLVIFMQVGTH